MVEDVAVTPAGKRRLVRIAVDHDLSRLGLTDDASTVPHLTLDEVADATRAVSAALDDTDAMGAAPYVLEVSSPGVDRPLTDPRHFRRNVGRLLQVTRLEGDPVRARLARGDADGVTVLDPGHQGPARARSTHSLRRHRPRPGAGRVRPRDRRGGLLMDIDLAALRALERERDISLDVIIPAIEQALLVAYHRTEGASGSPASSWTARPATSSSGPARTASRCPRSGERGDPGPEFDDTPDGFGRVAAATARQVIVQRLRDLEDEQILGDFRGREGDVVAGVIQQSRDPRTVLVDFGTVEGVLPLAEQVPGEKYVHGERLRCFV